MGLSECFSRCPVAADFASFQHYSHPHWKGYKNTLVLFPSAEVEVFLRGIWSSWVDLFSAPQLCFELLVTVTPRLCVSGFCLCWVGKWEVLLVERLQGAARCASPLSPALSSISGNGDGWVRSGADLLRHELLEGDCCPCHSIAFFLGLSELGVSTEKGKGVSILGFVCHTASITLYSALWTDLSVFQWNCISKNWC